MENAQLLSSRVAACNAPSPFRQDDISATELRQNCGGERVGQSALAEAPMTDEEREDAAYRAGVAMQVWYAKFKQTGNTDHLDIAYHYLGVQKALLEGRSAAFVAKLEKERGLA